MVGAGLEFQIDRSEFVPPHPGSNTLNGLYRFFLSRFGHKWGIDLGYFGLKIGYGFAL